MKLAVVEVLDRDGQARRTIPVSVWPITIGRAIDCDVELDDPHVAPHHATVAETDDGLVVTAGETLNGVVWRGTRLAGGATAKVPSGEVLQIGTTRLRVRRASDVLAPERPIAPEPVAGRAPVWLLLGGLFGWLLAGQWLTSDPGAKVNDYAEVVLAGAVALVIWCGLWALVTKLFRHRFEFWPHVRIAAGYVILIELVGFVLPLLAFMLSFGFLSRTANLAAGIVACAMIVAHLGRILPARRRVLALSVAAIFVVSWTAFASRNYQRADRVFDELYAATIAPPAFRLVAPVQPEQFLDESRRLKAILDAHAGDDDDDDDALAELMAR